MRKLLVIIAGPTASGKSSLAVDLALHFKTEIISADSRQLFRELTIGTAKPEKALLEQVPHHFINSHSVSEPFNAGMFADAALKLIDQLFEKHQVIIMCGGSGLYIDAVIYGMNVLPEASQEVRDELSRIYKSSGIGKLQEILKEKDPDTYNRIDINNPQRIMRALEIIQLSGKTFSAHLEIPPQSFAYDYLFAGIDWPRKDLYERINRRVQLMLDEGLVDEARSVTAFRNMNALKTVGYKEIFQYLDGELPFEKVGDLIAKNTRNYAKRQLTWFRKYKDMVWIKPGMEKNLIAMVEEKLRAK